MFPHPLTLASLTTLAFAGLLPAAETGPTPEQVRTAVNRGLPLLLKGAVGHTTHRTCFACHNQALPLLALTTAKTRGFDVPTKEIQKQAQFIADFLERNQENYLKGKGQGGQADTAGYALFALDLGDWKADATTAAVVEYLLQRDREAGHWKAVSRRPPSEISPFTTTLLAVRGLQKYGVSPQQERIRERVEKARDWLLKTKPIDTEDRMARLAALKLVGAKQDDVKAARQELIELQRKDGGWGQNDEMISDAYATGSVLVMLHQSGGLPVSDPVYQRGLKFLIGEQSEDGSWYVRSRSKPFQTYFETGFPHGKDQFISIAASGWATTALALACDPAPNRPAPPKKAD